MVTVAPCTSPPDNLPLHLTTLPLSLIHPPTSPSQVAQPAPPLITLTPTQPSHLRLSTPSPRRTAALLDNHEKIETPGWVMIKPGEDDEQEAREELEGGRVVPTSPLKRLRRLTGDEVSPSIPSQIGCVRYVCRC